MKTKVFLLVLAVFCLAGSAVGQPAGEAPALANPAPFALPAGVDTNINEVISLDPDFPLEAVLQMLANNAKLPIKYAPELLQNGRPGPLLSAPVGPARFERMTDFEALARLIRKNDLVLGRYANGPDVFVGTEDSKLTSLFPQAPGGGDLDQGPGETEFEVFADATQEIPLQTAILMLARFAKIPIVMDPKLKSGGERIVGTNLVTLPPITNLTVNLASMGSLPAKQRLVAILNVHDLVMIPDPISQTTTITYKEPGAREPQIPNVVPLRYSNTTNITDLITTTFPSARIRADVRTASLLVMSTQKEYEAITNLVALLDTPTKQVLIEARFLETLQNPKSIKGIDWTDTLQGNRMTFGNGTAGAESTSQRTTTTSPTVTPNGRPGPTVTTTSSGTTINHSSTFDAASPNLAVSTASGFSPATAFLNAQGVNVVLSALNTESDTRTLATPRAVTLDNQLTKLEVTRSIPIFDASESTSGASGAVVASSRPNYTNVGTILMVTPRISGSNVAMRVQPEISRVENQPSRKIVAGKVNEADIFAFNKIDTQVIIPSGNTLVMGGLLSDSTAKTFSKVPILGDIPLLGWAFRREGHERSKANLIIFVTPTIIDDADFQPYRTEFLNTAMPEHAKVTEGPMKSGKPAALGKKAKAEKAAEDAEEQAK